MKKTQPRFKRDKLLNLTTTLKAWQASQLRVFFFATLVVAFLLTFTASAEMLNPGFELGSYTNWTSVSGTAFEQPTTNAVWTLTTWEGVYYANSVFPDGNKPPNEPAVGVLRSDIFTFPDNHTLSFLVGGASTHYGYTNTWMTLNLASDDTVLDTVLADANTPPMVKKSFDAPAACGQEVYIEVVDDADEATGWAWIAVDDFKFEYLDLQNFDFENGYNYWGVSGLAWGSAPSTTSYWPGAQVGFDCHETYYALSLLGGETETGTIRSVDFTYPTDGSVKFLVCGHSTHFSPEIYNYVALKDAGDDTEYGRVYAPDQNTFVEMAITNHAANGKQVYIEAVDDCSEAGWAWLGLDYIQVETPIPDAPAGVSATQGSTNDRVIVSWYATAKADKYKVLRNTIDNTNAATDISGELGEFIVQFDDTTALDNSNYYYWVQAGNIYGWSPLSDYVIGFRTTSTGPDKPSNIFPADGSTPEFPISLAASAYIDSEGWPFVTSLWQISSESDCSSPRNDIYSGAVTNVSLDAGQIYTGTNYWRVRYRNERNKWSDWSDITLFIVDRDIDSSFYFYDTFNNVSGSGDVNKDFTISGRQYGKVIPVEYSIAGTTEIGDAATNPNELTLSGAGSACSPNWSFEDSGEFMIDVKITPSAAGSAITFGKASQNESAASGGGFGVIFYGDGSGKYDVYSGSTLAGTFTNDVVKSSELQVLLTASTIDFDNEQAYIAVTVNNAPLVLKRTWMSEMPATNLYDRWAYTFAYYKGDGFDKNYITLYNYGGDGVYDDLKISTIKAKFSTRTWENDDDTWIGTSNSVSDFTHAVNLNTDGNITVNELEFVGVGQGTNWLTPDTIPACSGTNWALFNSSGSMAWYDQDAPFSGDSGQILEHGLYGWSCSVGIILSNLVPNSINVLNIYGYPFDTTRPRISYISGSDGGLFEVDENEVIDKGQIIEYEYTAGSDGTFTIILTPEPAQDYFVYGFSSYLKEIAVPEIDVVEFLDFGEVSIIETKSMNLDIFNVGGGIVSGTVSFATVDGIFSVSTNDYYAEAKSSDTIEVTFEPFEEIDYSNTIYLTGSGTNGVVEVLLTGTGVPEMGIVFSILYSVIGIFIFRGRKSE